MSLKSLITEEGVQPRSSNLNSVYTSLLRLISIQEQNNDYLAGLTIVTGGFSSGDEGKAVVVNSAATGLVVEDQRDYIRLEDILTLASPRTSSTDVAVEATLGSTGAGTFTLAGATSGSDQFKVQIGGDTGTSSNVTVFDADTISLQGASIALTASSGLSIAGGATTISGLIYPTADGSANHVLTTNGLGTLVFSEMRAFDKKAYSASSSSYSFVHETLLNDSRMAIGLEAAASTSNLPAYSFKAEGLTGLGAQVDSGSKSHYIYIKYDDDYILRSSNTGNGDIIQLGNTATEFAAGTYSFIKPSMRDNSTAWPSGSAERAGALFYDSTDATLHYYTSSGSPTELATAASITNKLPSAGGALTGTLDLASVASLTTSLDLLFSGAGNTGFYAKDSISGVAGEKAVAFVYSSTGLLEFSQIGIHGAIASEVQNPLLNFKASDGDTAASPAYSFSGDSDTGMYRSIANTLSFSSNGLWQGSVSDSAGWNFAGKTVYNIATPTASSASSHAATKGYIDGIISVGTAANALVAFDGSKFVEVGDLVAPSSGGYQWLEIGGTDIGVLTLKHSGHAYNTTLQARAGMTGNLTLTLPSSDGAASLDILVTDGAGQLSFQNISLIGDSRYMQPGSAVMTDTLEVMGGTSGAPSIVYGSTGLAGSYMSSGQGYAQFAFSTTTFDDHADETITLIDTGGTSVTYTIKASGASAASQEFDRGAASTNAATNIVALINSSNGHNGSILATASGSTVKLLQNVGGVSGSSSISLSVNWAALCTTSPPSQFAGGGDSDALAFQLSAYTRVAQFANYICSGVAVPSIQGFQDKSSRMMTEPRADLGPMFTFVGRDTSGIGYREVDAVASTGQITFVSASSGSNYLTENITIFDSASNSVEFTFVATYTGATPKLTGATYEIQIGDITTTTELATRTAYSINFALGAEDLNISASSVTGTVSLINTVAGVGGNVTTTASSPTSDHTVSGMSGGADIIPSVTIHADSNATPTIEVSSASVTINNLQLKGLAAPTANTDASTKLYVDTQLSSVIAPNAAGSSIGEMLIHDTSSGIPVFSSELVYTSNELRVGDSTGTIGAAGSLKLATAYEFIEIEAPLATAASGTGSIAPYTLTLPTSAGVSKSVLVNSDGSGGLNFERRGAYTTQCEYTVSTLASQADWYSYRFDMELTLGTVPALDVLTGVAPPTGFTSSLTYVGDTNVEVGSSNTFFIEGAMFNVSINGVELGKGNIITRVNSTTIKIRQRLKAGDVILVKGLTSGDASNSGF